MTTQNKPLNIGVFIDGFRRPIREGLQLAAQLGCGSFQVYVTGGEMLAANMRDGIDMARAIKDCGSKS